MTELEAARVEAFMNERVAGFEGPLSVKRFDAGQSNPTYLIATSTERYVLRRKPAGPLLDTAHAVEREFAILSALAAHTDVPVPRPLALCADSAVIGSSFYVMEYVEGSIPAEASLPDLAKASRAAYYRSLIDTLAQLHGVDYAAIGLGHLHRPGAYCLRQVKRWSQQYVRDSAAGRVPKMERLIDWLGTHLPTDESESLIHGDFRWGNVMFDANTPVVVAILDWELATLGHPLADLAHTLMCYRMPSIGVSGLLDCDIDALGIPAEEEVIRRYCEQVGRTDVPNLGYFLAFSMFRLAAIFHGIRGRILRGTAASPLAQNYAAQVEPLADLAWATALQAERDSGD